MGRLNGVVAALERGDPAFVAFSSAGVFNAIEASHWPYHGVILEMEHEPYSTAGVREFLQFLLDRRQIHEQESVAPAITPLVRIPSARHELNTWMARQSLDQGAFGIVWPHVETVEQARAAVATCRYADADASAGPRGTRGAGAGAAARYFGLSPDEYYARADTWPLAPHGEIFVVVMIESPEGVANLPAILAEVPGIGAVFIGHGDLSRALGGAGHQAHDDLEQASNGVLRACSAAGVACGRVVRVDGVEEAVDEGYRFIVVQREMPPSLSTGQR